MFTVITKITNHWVLSRNFNLPSFPPGSLCKRVGKRAADAVQVESLCQGDHPVGSTGYVAYPISYRRLVEMMQESGLVVDQSTLNRWVVKYAPTLENHFRLLKRSVGKSWRLDETYIKVRGEWKYLYRAVDRDG